MECEYCKNTFSNKYVLRNHQKRTKYCLNEQKKQGHNTSEELIKCKYCKKSFTIPIMDKHILKCKTKSSVIISRLEKRLIKKDKDMNILQEIIISLQSELKVYKSLSEKSQECIKEIAKEPKTKITSTTNNNLNLMTPLDMKECTFSQKIKDHFTEDYFMEGQRGVARFAVDKLLKDEDGKLKYVCTDPSRHIYKFKTKDGDVDRDVKAQKLTKVIWSDLVKKSQDITNDGIRDKDDNVDIFLLYTGKYMDIKDMDTDNEKFRSTLASLTV
jgi:hypothetical protein